jgi:hypothetical protein
MFGLPRRCHGAYRYRSVTGHTATIGTRVDHCPRLGPDSDDYDSDDVLMAKTVRGESLGIKMT